MLKHGFRLSRSADPVCTETLVADLTNIHFSGPAENIERHDEVARRQGHLGCDVHSEPLLPGEATEITASAGKGNADARLILANVDCALYLDDETPRARLDDLGEIGETR